MVMNIVLSKKYFHDFENKKIEQVTTIKHDHNVHHKHKKSIKGSKIINITFDERYG